MERKRVGVSTSTKGGLWCSSREARTAANTRLRRRRLRCMASLRRSRWRWARRCSSAGGALLLLLGSRGRPAGGGLLSTVRLCTPTSMAPVACAAFSSPAPLASTSPSTDTMLSSRRPPARAARGVALPCTTACTTP